MYGFAFGRVKHTTHTYPGRPSSVSSDIETMEPALGQYRCIMPDQTLVPEGLAVLVGRFEQTTIRGTLYTRLIVLQRVPASFANAEEMIGKLAKAVGIAGAK